MDWIEKYLLQKKKIWLTVVALFIAFAAWQALHIPIVTSTDAIIPRDEAWHFYEEFRQEFGADDALVVALAADDILSPEVISYIRLLTSAFEEFPEVEDALSLSNVEDIFGSEEDFTVEPLIGDRDLSDPKVRQWVESRIKKNPLIYGNLVSRDLQATIILLRTAYRGEDLDFEHRLVNRVTRYLDEHPPPDGVSLHLSGWPLVNVKMAAFMNQDLMVFVPVSFLALCLLVYFFLRSLRATLAMALIIDLSLISAMAALKLVGGALSPMTAILAPLTMALSLADVIHVVTTYFRLPSGPRRVAQTVAETWSPCFLTSLTTAIGFASLLLSRIPSIREFGAAAAAAMFIEYFLTFTVLVYLLPWIGRGRWGQGSLRRIVEPLARSYPA
ncbi:MAG: MMPL family transporter, partial [Thermodesulfobacteria bacterium]|nr:MMPL family transporter [Thermodesulfobacteriota bacterium]